MLINGLFNAQRVSELKAYAESLDDDSVAPKLKILEIVGKIEDEQRKIAMIQAQSQIMQQRASQFLMGDPDQQSSMMADAMMQIQAQEEQYKEQEAELDEETAEAEEELPEPEE